MKQGVDIPEWIEKIMAIWVRHHKKPLPKELRQLWREAHKAKAVELEKVQRDKLTGWQRAWFEWLLEANETLSEEDLSLQIDEPEDRPAWYENLELKVMGAFVPTINFKALLEKRSSQSLAITCGEWVGHEKMAWCAEPTAVAAALEKAPDEYRKAMTGLLDYVRPARLKMVDKALSIANRQSPKECQQFFRGYYLALDKGTFKGTGEPAGSDYATPIHMTMYCFADFLPHLKNNRELLEWLKAILGNNQSWNDSSQKRVEKIAQRLELHLEQLSQGADT